MAYGAYVLRLVNKAGEAVTLYYITLTDALKIIRERNDAYVTLVREYNESGKSWGKQSVVFAYGKNF